ncbi:hypothetical protein WN943_021730 [Citrus x changshan-huyou]
MPVPGFLGLHGLLVVVLLVFYSLIRQKCKNAVARKEEVTKLMAVAAEESLMEEFQAANQHSFLPSSPPRLYQCAVCFRSTTTRCSRCKAVRYCSGKCQIFHWRQGHKDECRPQRIITPLREDGDSVTVAGPEKQFEICGNQALGSSTIDRVESPICDSITPDMPETRSRIKKSKQTMSPSADSANMVIDVDGTSRASKLDKMKLSHNDEDVNIRPQISKVKTTLPDDVQPVKLGDKKSNGGAASPEFLVKDSSTFKSRTSVSCSRFDPVTKVGEDDSQSFTGKHVSSSAPRSSLTIGRHSLSNYKSVLPAKISSIPSLPQNACHGLKSSMQKVVQQFRVSKPLKSYSLGSEDEVVGKSNEKPLFPYDLFMKLYSYDKVELYPFGLINCGNSCYANAVLQCLAFTRPLTSYLVQGLHSKACQKKGWCFICEFERLILNAKDGSYPVSPIGILSKIQKIGSHLGHGREEDAHEFLRCAVDTMQSVCLKEFGAKGKIAEETTLIGLTFGGYLRSKIKCLKCLGKSELYERMMDLTVEIDGDIGTLEEALAQFTASEILVGENKYYCCRCKSYEKAKKKLTVLEEPNILTIVLKRFESGNFGKLNKSVWFPEVLNMAPYMSRTGDGSPMYSLYAVVVHLDVTNATFSGHYVCYVKNSHEEWFRIDDSTVIPVKLERVLSEEAYMLLYARHSPRPPALIRNNVSHGVKSKKKSLEAVGLNNTSKVRSNSYIPSLDSKAQQKPCTDSNQLFDRDEWKFRSMQRSPAVDSLSESSSIFSWSDVSSCSTASTKESSRSEDLSDLIFGDTPSWYRSYGITSDSIASSSYQNSNVGSEGENDAWQHGWREGLGRDGNPAILFTESTKQYRNLGHQYVSNGSSRDIDSDRVGWANPSDVRLRRANGDYRSAQPFY